MPSSRSLQHTTGNDELLRRETLSIIHIFLRPEVVELSRESYEKVFSLIEEHHKWFSASIPLIASENIPSPAVREAYISDFGNRYAERAHNKSSRMAGPEKECMQAANI